MTKLNKMWIALVAWLIQVVEAVISDPNFTETIADSNVTESEMVRLIVTAILGVYGVYQIKNIPPVGEAANPNESVANR